MKTNRFGQPMGEPLPDWRASEEPPQTVMTGRYCRVEPLDVTRHGADLCAAYGADPDGRIWTYMSIGPFDSPDACREWLNGLRGSRDPLFFAFVDAATNKALGLGSYVRISPAIGSIEIGYIAFSPLMQRKTMATEVIYLMMRRAFEELGYRRCEWKCDSLNQPSRRAAERFGFTYEGTFRQATIYKGRNRDTAWHAVLDSEWPSCRAIFERWLDPENFDSDGRQILSMEDMRKAAAGAAFRT